MYPKEVTDTFGIHTALSDTSRYMYLGRFLDGVTSIPELPGGHAARAISLQDV